MKRNTLVKFDYVSMPKEYHKQYLDIFPVNQAFIYLGDITQMEGHCVLASIETGKIITGYHTENFIPLTDTEL